VSHADNCPLPHPLPLLSHMRRLFSFGPFSSGASVIKFPFHAGRRREMGSRVGRSPEDSMGQASRSRIERIAGPYYLSVLSARECVTAKHTANKARARAGRIGVARTRVVNNITEITSS